MGISSSKASHKNSAGLIRRHGWFFTREAGEGEDFLVQPEVVAEEACGVGQIEGISRKRGAAGIAAPCTPRNWPR